MRRNIQFMVCTIAAAISVFLLSLACSKQPDLFDDSGDIKAVFIADSFAPGETTTKTVLEGTEFTWAANDTVGIYPNSGSQIFFEMTQGAGTGSAVFDGGGWAFRNGATYYSYYPFIADFHLDRTQIPVSFKGQHQNGLSSLDHFGQFDYMYADAASVRDGVITFNYHHLCCVIRVTATLEPGTYRQLTITAPDSAFVQKGFFDLTSDAPTIQAAESGCELTVVLDNFTVNTKQEVRIYLVSAPVALSGKEITVSILDSEKKQYDCKKTPSKDYAASGIYGLTCSTWTEVPQSVGIAIDGWADGGHYSGGAE